MEERLGLDKGFSISEIELALHSLGSDKAPGPDDFNILYIKKNLAINQGESLGLFGIL